MVTGVMDSASGPMTSSEGGKKDTHTHTHSEKDTHAERKRE